jgi:DNA-binding beta-propeller fold protein YncE
VNDNPGIGLPASGTGNIASFTAVNTGSTPVTATITATPVATGFAYIPNYYDGGVSVISTVNNMVETTIDVVGSLVGVAVSPDGTKAYVTN